MLSMKPICAGVLLLGRVSPAFAEEATLAEARNRWLKGNYEEARDQYEERDKQPNQTAAAVIGISRCCQSEGAYDKASTVVDAALLERPENADLHARRSEVLSLRDR